MLDTAWPVNVGGKQKRCENDMIMACRCTRTQNYIAPAARSQPKNAVNDDKTTMNNNEENVSNNNKKRRAVNFSPPDRGKPKRARWGHGEERRKEKERAAAYSTQYSSGLGFSINVSSLARTNVHLAFSISPCPHLFLPRFRIHGLRETFLSLSLLVPLSEAKRERRWA